MQTAQHWCFPVASLSKDGVCRLAQIWLIGVVFRMKFYFVWTLSDANLTLAGFGFNGWRDKAARKARWDRQTNGWPVQIELSPSTSSLMHVWNCKTGLFLRRCAHSCAGERCAIAPAHGSALPNNAAKRCCARTWGY